MRRSSLSTALKILLAVGLMAYLVYAVEPAHILDTAAQANPWWIAVAVGLLPVNLLLEGVVWRRLVRTVVPDVSRRQALASLLCGYPLGIVTPGRLGELAGRAFYLHYPDKWELSAVVLTQRMLDMVAAIDVGLAALLYFIVQYAPEPAALWWSLAAFGAGAAGTLTAGAFFPKGTYRVIRRLTSREPIRRRAAFLQRLATPYMAGVIGLTALRYAVYITQFVLLALAFAPALDLGIAYLGAGLVFYAKFLIPPLTFLDIGIREGAAVFFFGALDLPTVVAFNASFLLFCVNLLLPAAVGLPFVLRLRLENKRAEASEEPSPDARPTPDAKLDAP